MPNSEAQSTLANNHDPKILEVIEQFVQQGMLQRVDADAYQAMYEGFYAKTGDKLTAGRLVALHLRASKAYADRRKSLIARESLKKIAIVSGLAGAGTAFITWQSIIYRGDSLRALIAGTGMTLLVCSVLLAIVWFLRK